MQVIKRVDRGENLVLDDMPPSQQKKIPQPSAMRELNTIGERLEGSIEFRTHCGINATNTSVQSKP